ncbi:transcriptional regulator, XRE family [Mucilaginibacter lappiensis]|uniref:Transcriptional regulator with XRE-family HTH domain n=1 Tax=Mucilaginibacter lappiensis TaxID=354630 RepID=A0ABR6PG11_9SPHI|nr:helix-turn-helix transcriptional regulator [Mucilaginibacter lappiensis]MBB6108702.1 transcriptional regulator with XRE-family HTH domain [Mucilaginibacter lappiensis]SIQ27219.1 transcriptional regulator, XRE family [Mucilaginibacter lappiensis]
MISDLDKGVLMLFGNHLKSLRLAKDLTYRKMALNCNIDYGDIQKIESGKVNITILTLIELANALDVEPKLLLDFKGVRSIIH